ncbi:hypothetical protein EX30DRAFT_210876 [Ascodesmis nigricans]|uniref:Uncharacterized protein n=1 Tax=Ascodesmis nigricans TaxID=341454 RepID=A0A4S2MQZ0_9PEZI|nr:hypothetical protein EX30DRAFT_210876 [Ascodesmis nigricans]
MVSVPLLVSYLMLRRHTRVSSSGFGCVLGIGMSTLAESRGSIVGCARHIWSFVVGRIRRLWGFGIVVWMSELSWLLRGWRLVRVVSERRKG